jgi:glycerophosphoryl diester phosphodiesterase
MEASGFERCPSVLKKLISVKPWPKGALSVPRFQAHRGYWVNGAKENTLEAFRAAKAAGALMVEMDVQLSKDGIPVIFHDYDISRFSTEANPVSALTAKELRARVNAPSLQEVLQDPQAPLYFNIELKTEKFWNDALERKVFEVIHKTQSESKVLISSFNPASLWRMGLYTQDIPLALLVANDMDDRFLREMWLAPFLSFHLLHLDQRMLEGDGAQELEFWKSQGVPVAVWTVNDPAKAKALLEQGALSIISDQIITEVSLI